MSQDIMKDDLARMVALYEEARRLLAQLGLEPDQVEMISRESAGWASGALFWGERHRRQSLHKTAVSVIINTTGQDTNREIWPPVIICGPKKEAGLEPEAPGRQILELLYNSARVVGILLERDDQKIIRVEVHERHTYEPPHADTGGEPTLKYGLPQKNKEDLPADTRGHPLLGRRVTCWGLAGP
ncbi:hypothetical protein DFAR_910018 [Desulfarculales bacterium]